MKSLQHPKNSKWQLKVLRSLTTDVLVHGHITTTEERAKEVKRHVEKMITLAKRAGEVETQEEKLPYVRQASEFLRKKETKAKKPIINYLFEDLAKKYKERSGGYTRIIKAPNRRGDNAKQAILELV